MAKYIPFKFDSQYENETSQVRYQRLTQEFKDEQQVFLAGLREQLSHQSAAEKVEQSILLCETQLDQFLSDIIAC